MDSKQFDLFMKTLTAALSSQSAPHPQMIPFESFDGRNEKFSAYLDRFENYCELKNINENKKKAQLLCSSIGKECYNNLAAFLGPDQPVKEIEYSDLVTHFLKMLSPTVSTVVAQHYFLNITQQPQQSISDFVATLKGNLKDCDFYVLCPSASCKRKISIADTFLRAQFIRGLKDNWIREQLLQDYSDDKNFETLLKKATALEASRYESNQLTKPIDRSSDSLEHTHRVTRESRPHHRNRNPQQPHARNNSRPSSPHQGHRSPSHPRKHRVDYKALGINGFCLNCGRANHLSRDCRTDRQSLKCTACKRTGHVAKVCITTLLRNHRTHAVSSQNNTDEDQTSDNSYGVVRIEENLHRIGSDTDKYMVTVQLNGKPQIFEVDSGARFSLLSETDFNNLNLGVPVESTPVSFRSYSDHIIKPKGKVTLSVSYKNKTLKNDLYIVPHGYEALLGRMWIRGLGINLDDIDHCRPTLSRNPDNINMVSTALHDILQRYSAIFEEKVGCAPNVTVKLHLREDAKPIFIKQRDVPFALRERVEKELKTLESQDIITPVATSDWGSPLVVIAKPDGGVRLCVDYKCGVNQRLVAANHPIRRIDEVLHSLRGSRFFCKLDLHKAYLHLKVDNEGSKIQTISTHMGTFRMNRLSFGIKTAPAEFNRILSQLLSGLTKVEAYFDDIICHGSTLEECTQNLIACLERLKTNDLHLNRGKCSFFKENIKYLGHVVSFNKIEKCPTKVLAVAQMPRPKNADELRRFLGLVTYYAKFIPDFSSTSYPLRCLLRKDVKFHWTAPAEASFLNLKSELCSDRVLTPFDPSKPVVLTTDASPTGIAAILSHEINGCEKPVAYASRSLTPAESNYSQLDREALAIVYAATHFFNYIFGKHFVLVTDNEPLTRIFHPNQSLPQMTSARLLRYASFLSGLDYTVRCKKGKDNENVDCLSRAPITPSHPQQITIDEEINALHAETIQQISSSAITVDTIIDATANDPELKVLLKELQNSRKNSPYTVSSNMLFKSDRVVIPKSLQPAILEELHSSHLGITKMKQLSRRYVYWEGLDKDIEHIVKSCEACAKVRHNPPKAIVHPWDQPGDNWERVHIDFAGPINNLFLLMVVDAKSKWAEVRTLRDAPSSSSTTSLLDDIFSVHGYPCVMVSDNATIFKSGEFQQYCKTNGIFQKFSAPNHPATNGLAERNIQTLKRRLKATADEPGSLSDKLRSILFRYRATPLASGHSPAELYLKRRLRIRMDALLPNKKAFIPLNPSTSRVRSLQVGERVQARIFQDNHDIWKFGTVTKKLGQFHYIVELDDGRSVKRHINQLISSLVPKKHVTFAMPQLTQQRRGIPFLGDVPSAQPAPQIPLTPPAPPDLPTLGRNRRPPPYLRDYVTHF